MAAVLALVGLLAGIAVAGHWLDGASYKAGDRDVYFWQCNVSSTVHDQFHKNDEHDVDPTVIRTHLAHDCDIRDVGLEDTTYGTDDPVGWYHCHSHHSADVCDKGEVHINLSYSGVGPDHPNNTLALVCQEIGHSIGLGHRPASSNSCMYQVYSVAHAHFDDHDVNAINDHY